MIRLISIYFLIGIVTLVGTALFESLSLYLFSGANVDVYRKSIDVLTRVPNSCARVKKMLKDKNNHGCQRCIINVMINVATFPYTVPILLSRYPKAKEYVINNRNVKIRES